MKVEVAVLPLRSRADNRVSVQCGNPVISVMSRRLGGEVGRRGGGGGVSGARLICDGIVGRF